MLTQKGLDQIEELIEEKIKFLPTKDDFYVQMDKILGELKAIREDKIVLTHRVVKIQDRLEKLEIIHPRGKHSHLTV